MRTAVRLLLPICGLLLVGACAPATSGARSAGPNLNVITAEDIAQATGTTAYQLVQSLRPEWLRPRPVQNLSETTHTRPVGSGRNSSGDVTQGQGTVTVPGGGQPQVLVYMGQARLGDVKSLQQVLASDVATIEYLDIAKANFRFGQGHTHGAIVITPK